VNVNFHQQSANHPDRSIAGKWYCCYHEVRGTIQIARYLHPTGWKKFAFWWTSRGEAEQTLQRVGATPIPVSETEYTDHRLMQADIEWVEEENERAFSGSVSPRTQEPSFA